MPRTMSDQNNTPNGSDPLQPDLAPKTGHWWSEMTGYHWWVLLLATLGWMFDCMDQRLFVIARQPAMQDLLGWGELAASELTTEQAAEIKFYGGISTTALIVGWATGGIFFGLMGDRWGRVRTMALTILVYSLFTGLSGLSVYWWDFVIYRFLTGMGVGGEFAAGAALVAEVMPERARPYCLGLLQALSAVGNITGSIISRFIMPWDGIAFIPGGWRAMFFVGILPALLVVLVRVTLKEPERWAEAKAKEARGEGDPTKKELGSLAQLFTDKTWRYHTIIGVGLAVTGVVGLWGIGFYSPELVRDALADLSKDKKDAVVAWGTMLQDFGALAGIFCFSLVAGMVGRRPAFAIAFLLGFASIVLTFGFMRTETHVYWMLPILGFSTLTVFGGYAIYFPELYPTRLRSTGTGFCYNVARYLAAGAPMALGALGYCLSGLFPVNFFRVAAVLVAGFYFVGLIFVYFAPETKDKPLPE